MLLIQEQQVTGDQMGAPYARVVKHLVAPWTVGSARLWMGISVIEPSSASNPHAHFGQEEAFYCVSGKGLIRVGEEHAEIGPGSCVFVPEGLVHQLINTEGDEELRVLSASAPPFSREGWSLTHQADA